MSIVMKLKKTFKWSPKKLKTALLPISVLSCILGFKIFQFPHGYRRTIFSYFYTLTMIFSLSIIFFYDGYNRCYYGEDFLKINHDVIVFVYACNQLSAILSVILTLWMNKEIELCIEGIELLNQNLNGFQSRDIYRKIFIHNFFMILTYFIILFLTAFLEIFIFVEDNVSFLKICYCTLFYRLPMFMQGTIDFNFGLLVKCIGHSFKHMNNILKMESRLILLTSELHKKNARRKLNIIKLIKLQHLELSKIARKLNEIYKIQIFISIIVNFLTEIIVLYLICFAYFKNVKNNINLAVSMYLDVVFLWIGYFFKIIYVNSVCYDVTLEVTKTQEYLLYLLKDTIIVQEINEFIEQIEQNPLLFTLFGVQLNHGMITIFILAMADKLTIVIQLYPVRET